MKLCEMAQEYRVNVALLELRIKQLQVLYALKDFLIKRLRSLLEHIT